MLTADEKVALEKTIETDGARGHAQTIIRSLAARAKNQEGIGAKTLEWLDAYPNSASLVKAIIDRRFGEWIADFLDYATSYASALLAEAGASRGMTGGDAGRKTDVMTGAQERNAPIGSNAGMAERKVRITNLMTRESAKQQKRAVQASLF
ncbi:MAG: hypothetical protein LBN32_01495 [Helicobacteraceae bacterium]|nr:hypothetical protein [Helicobacteraceae bacterium]